MLDQLTLDQFQPLIEQTFTVSIPELPHAVPLALTSVSSLGPAVSGARRAPFSLLFTGPLTPVLPQRIYPLAHSEFGILELFIVPLGPDAERRGMRYEAIFT